VRRPAVLLAAALAGALSVAVVSASTRDASASASPAVDVAAELGLTGDGGTPSAAVAPDRLRALAASRAQRQAERTSAAAARAAADQAAVEAARPKTVNPAPGTLLTSTFAMRWGVMHWGIDLAGPVGTPEYAAADGVVLRAGPASGFGQAVWIQGADGDVTLYGHMEKLLVHEGQVVKAGDQIALMGSEGESTGPHLHFEVEQGGMDGPRTDPVPWLAARGVHVP
jgi:murein DD-endopeptidase MepM/ murein hydrolase activator NlpD